MEPEKEATAGGDLLKYHRITDKFYNAATKMQPGNYLKSLPGDTTWYRGDKCDLAPLAELPPPQGDIIGWKPSRAELQAFRLDPGTFEMDKAEMGQAVETGLSPEGGQDMGKVQTSAPAAAYPAEKPKKEKKHKKEKKEKKEKKHSKRPRTG